jgi:hypothetical protein
MTRLAGERDSSSTADGADQVCHSPPMDLTNHIPLWAGLLANAIRHPPPVELTRFVMHLQWT